MKGTLHRIGRALMLIVVLGKFVEGDDVLPVALKGGYSIGMPSTLTLSW